MLVNSKDIEPRHREAFWRDEVCPHIYRIEPDSIPGEFRFRGDVRDIGDLGFAYIGASVIRRRRTRVDIARDGFDAIAAQRAVAGPVEIAFSRETVTLAQGDWVVLGMDWQCEMRGSGAIGLLSLELPRSVFSPLLAGGALRRPVPISCASPLGALVTAGIESAWRHVPALGPSVGEGALRHLAGLVALACGASAEGDAKGWAGAAQARLRAAHVHIDRHLADPALSPASVAAALGVSARYLHRLFEPTGESFAQYVTRQRLAACRATLENAAERGRSVADIAFGWGFASLPTFYRVFAAAYGRPPTDLRPSVR